MLIGNALNPPTPFLNQLKVTDRNNLESVEPTLRIRRKVTDAIAEQIEAVTADIQHKPYTPTKTVYGVDQNGTRTRTTVNRRRKNWYFIQHGVWYTEIKYGIVNLKFNNGSLIEGESNQNSLINIYQIVTQAIDNGELDQQLREVNLTRKTK